ncbi:MAG TPA: fluoride efflux transporter CrcB [Longimicrobium sp.]|nr:fluoride efflux transporter CrcB [Longimicrobium sp.]
MLVLWLAAGGIAGTLARYGLGRWVHSWAGIAFPWGTFAINLMGSFVLGVLLRGFEGSAVTPEVRAGLTAGFCGAFTTFSTFTFETVALMEAGAWGRAFAYSLGSLVLGLAAAWAGIQAAPYVFRPGA